MKINNKIKRGITKTWGRKEGKANRKAIRQFYSKIEN